MLKGQMSLTKRKKKRSSDSFNKAAKKSKISYMPTRSNQILSMPNNQIHNVTTLHAWTRLTILFPKLESKHIYI